MPRFRAAAALALAAILAGPALAQSDLQTIWNCKDKDGRTLVTSLKEDTAGKECRIVQQTRVTVVPGTKVPVAPAAPGASAVPGAPTKSTAKPVASVPSPAGFPKETTNDRLKGREKQRQLLESELSQEEQLLAQAKRELAQQETTRSGDERNYAKVLERLQKYRDNVEVHEKNIEALKRELATLYR
jgi:hypothetical protein